MLRDLNHKLPKSGVQVGPGNTITIQSGVGTPTSINVLSFGQSGTLLAAGKDFGRVVVWNVVTRKVVCAIETGQGIIHAVAISPDGEFLATAGEGDRSSLKLWHLPNGKLIKKFRSSAGYIQSLSFGPNSKWVVFSENSGPTRVLKLSSGKTLLDLQGAFSPVLSVDGTVLMVATKDRLSLWNTSDWAMIRELPSKHAYAVPLAVDPKTDRFVFTAGGAFYLANLRTGELMQSTQRPVLPGFNLAAGGFAAFDPSAPDLLFGHSSGRLWGWDVRTGKTCASGVLYSESGALTPDGTLLAGAKDNSIFQQGQSPDGVLLWDTKQLAKTCGLAPDRPVPDER